jgi:hypothetical protein
MIVALWYAVDLMSKEATQLLVACALTSIFPMLPIDFGDHPLLVYVSFPPHFILNLSINQSINQTINQLETLID